MYGDSLLQLGQWQFNLFSEIYMQSYVNKNSQRILLWSEPPKSHKSLLTLSIEYLYIIQFLIYYANHPCGILNVVINIHFVISRRRRRPGDGRYCNAPRLSVRPSVRLSVRLSVCPSVRPSITFSFRTVTQKRIAVFSRNFAATCTKWWGCAV